jgi:hypothetical protein
VALAVASSTFALGCASDAGGEGDEDASDDAQALATAVAAEDDTAEPAAYDDEDVPEPAEAAPPSGDVGTSQSALTSDPSCSEGCVRVMTANIYFGGQYPKGWREVRDGKSQALCPVRKLGPACNRLDGYAARGAHWVTVGTQQGLADEVRRIGDVGVIGVQEANNPDIPAKDGNLAQHRAWGGKQIIAQELARRLSRTTGKTWRYDDAPRDCSTGRTNDPACLGFGADSAIFWREDVVRLVSAQPGAKGPGALFETVAKKGAPAKRFVFESNSLSANVDKGIGNRQGARLADWAKGELSAAKTVVLAMDMNEEVSGPRHDAMRAAGFVTTRKAKTKRVPWMDYLWVNGPSGFVKVQIVSHDFGSDHRARWADVRLR